MIDVTLGWKNIACIHLNDSKHKSNSKKDEHADIGKGYIKKPGLKKFTKICVDHNIPIVMETPCDVLSKKKQIKLVKKWF